MDARFPQLESLTLDTTAADAAHVQGPEIHIQPPRSAIYQPLDSTKNEIRLLRVLPGGGDETIHCVFETLCLGASAILSHWDRSSGIVEEDDWHAKAVGGPGANAEDNLNAEDDHNTDEEIYPYSYEDDDPWSGGKDDLSGSEGRETVYYDYETISYCWGDSKLRGSVVVNGLSLDVPQSSEEAIRAVRQPENSRTIWIDAVCIDQANLDERNSQVVAMGSIYQRASRNIIFFGNDHDDIAERTFNLLHKHMAIIRQAEDGLHLEERESWYAAIRPPSAWVENSPLLGSDWLSLLPLFILPWFTRIWTFQEMALAHINICIWGSFEVDLLEVVTVAEVMVTSKESIADKFEDYYAGPFIVAGLRKYLVNGPDTFTIDMVRNVTTDRSATDPRDHVFGLIGALQTRSRNASFSHRIMVDYERAVHEVFRDATRAYLLDKDDLILYEQPYNPTDRHGVTTCPSWTASWEKHGSERRLELSTDFRSGRKHNVEGLPARLFIKEPAVDPKILSVKGFLVGGLIKWIGPLLEDVNEDLYRRRSTSLETLIHHLRSHVQAENSETELQIIATLLRIKFWNPYRPALKTAQGFAQALLELIDDIQHFGDDEASWRPTSRLAREELVRLGRPVALTKGLVGTAVADVQCGDTAFIMLNGKVVHILRPADHGSHYLLVGPAYIHGLMDGEVFDMNIEPTWVDIW